MKIHAMTVPRARRIVISLIGTLLALGCAHPAQTACFYRSDYDLTRFRRVGVFEFSSSTHDAELPSLATRQFIEKLKAGQPSAQFVELGSLPVGVAQLDAAAIRALGVKFGVEAIFIGTLEMAKQPPAAPVNITSEMHVALYKASDGAVAWSQTGTDQEPVEGAADGGRINEAASRMVVRSANALAAPLIPHLVQVQIDN